MTIDDIYNKLEELNQKLDDLKKFDYYAKNIKNEGNFIVDNEGNPLKVKYAENAKTINGKTYDVFFQDMKKFFQSTINDIKVMIKKEIEKRPIDANYIKDWTDLKINPDKDIQTITLDTIDFIPNYLEILVKVDKCYDKNGGSNGIITQIPGIGISADGIPFDLSNPDNVLNYSGWWYEGGEIKIFVKKADFSQWIGKCKSIQYKILAWR